MTSHTYRVSGMTCAHCESAVAAELREIDGVDDVDVELVPGGVSTVQVTSRSAISRAQVVAALDEAGDYHLVEPRV